MNKYIISITLMVIALFFLLVSIPKEFTESHESVHKAIFQNEGCKNVTTHITYFKGGWAKCNDENFTHTEGGIALHSINEIVSYNLQTLIYTIICAVLFLVSAMFFVGFMLLEVWTR